MTRVGCSRVVLRRHDVAIDSPFLGLSRKLSLDARRCEPTQLGLTAWDGVDLAQAARVRLSLNSIVTWGWTTVIGSAGGEMPKSVICTAIVPSA
jgi:hypothetical protein